VISETVISKIGRSRRPESGVRMLALFHRNTDYWPTDYFRVPPTAHKLRANGFLDDQMIHDKLPAGGGVLAHVELE
jgi:hypothetical protein